MKRNVENVAIREMRRDLVAFFYNFLHQCLPTVDSIGGCFHDLHDLFSVIMGGQNVFLILVVSCVSRNVYMLVFDDMYVV